MSDRLTRGIEAMRAQMDSRVMSYMSSCVHCGVCAEACLFYTETGDARYTPIYKTEPLRKLWRQEYTFWGKLAASAGLVKNWSTTVAPCAAAAAWCARSASTSPISSAR